jgi:hypothetical protein
VREAEAFKKRARQEGKKAVEKGTFTASTEVIESDA